MTRGDTNSSEHEGQPGVDMHGAGGPDGIADEPFGVLSGPAAEALKAYRQADVLEEFKTVLVTGPTGDEVLLPAPLGVVVLSQTCDVVLSTRPAVQLARRVRLGVREALEARDGKRPRYAHLPEIGERDFADLEVVMTVAKSHIASARRLPGVATDEQVRRFAGAVARKYGRFPFPDDVTPWLRPLESVVGSKARKPNSPEGRLLDDVVELRVEAAGGWGTPPYELTLCVIVKPGVLPTFPDDELPDLPVGLNGWLHNDDGELVRNSAQVGERLVMATEPGERYWLWAALGDAWAARCQPSGQPPASVLAAVDSLTAEVLSADEFPLTRVRRSEILDLDHLSGPTPELA